MTIALSCLPAALAGALALFAPCLLPAQLDPAFEVASVKPAAKGNRRDRMGPGIVSLNHRTLQALIIQAYGVKRYQIDGPEWLPEYEYDIDARMPAQAKREQIPAMLQSLLAERFKLQAHREARVLQVYALLTANGQPKHAEVGAGAPKGWPVKPWVGARWFRPVDEPYWAGVMGELATEDLAYFLTNELDRPVLDFTGLKGVYYIDVRWDRGGSEPDEPAVETPEDRGMAPLPKAQASSVSSALQKRLGLKLEPREAPVEMLVIDRVEMTPTAN